MFFFQQLTICCALIAPVCIIIKHVRHSMIRRLGNTFRKNKFISVCYVCVLGTFAEAVINNKMNNTNTSIFYLQTTCAESDRLAYNVQFIILRVIICCLYFVSIVTNALLLWLLIRVAVIERVMRLEGKQLSSFPRQQFLLILWKTNIFWTFSNC